MMKKCPEAELLRAHMKCIGKRSSGKVAVKNSPNIIDFKEAAQLFSIHRGRLNRGAFEITVHELMRREM
jgi:hypothetical protein